MGDTKLLLPIVDVVSFEIWKYLLHVHALGYITYAQDWGTSPSLFG